MDELLYWCLSETREYEGINKVIITIVELFLYVKLLFSLNLFIFLYQDDIHASLCDGLAWCALVHKFEPDALNYQMTYYAATKLNRFVVICESRVNFFILFLISFSLNKK